MLIDNRPSKKVSMNRQALKDSKIFTCRRTKVKWPTIRHAYMTDENVEALRKYVTGKGRSIVFLDGSYVTKLNRYVRKDPNERAVFFEFMAKEKGYKGAIFLLCWIGNFHNGCIFHAAPQYPQMQCWVDVLGYKKAMEFFDNQAFSIYQKVVDILSNGQPPKDKEVRDFLKNGQLPIYGKASR